MFALGGKAEVAGRAATSEFNPKRTQAAIFQCGGRDSGERGACFCTRVPRQT
jgi:hypothetical protein